MLIDTHAHLDDSRFAADFDPMLDRANAAKLIAVVSVGTSADSSAATLHLARRYPQFLMPTAGIHPNHAAQEPANAWDRILNLAREPDVVGIGETGLDRHWNDTPFPMQEDFFSRHLALSRTLKKPIIIHCREAEADVLRMLREDFDRHGPIIGVMHSFAGDRAFAEAAVAMGLCISLSGILTYKNAEAIRDAVKAVPLDRLMVETDCPYLPPTPHRGKRNEPAYVALTAAKLAETIGRGEAEIGELTTANAKRLFGIE
ncbi:MAG: TatD family hydrolase [Gemmataceae bacterium]